MVGWDLLTLSEFLPNRPLKSRSQYKWSDFKKPLRRRGKGCYLLGLSWFVETQPLRMRSFCSVTLALTAFVEFALAGEPICADACLTLATNYVYDNCSPLSELYYDCRCVNPYFLGSIAICIKEHCNGEGWEWIDKDICQEYGETAPIPSLETVVSNATQYVTDPPTNISLPLTSPIRYNDMDFLYSFETVNDFDGNMTDGSFFGYDMFAVFA